MEARPLSIEGAFEIRPVLHRDERGVNLEWFRADVLASLIGRPFVLAQANLSVSMRHVLRGIHFAQVPPGQAKFVTCVAGAGLDVVVDLRVGSPTFGHHEMIGIDDEDHIAVYLAEGLGHAFMATSDTATLNYLLSSPYAPDREHTIDPFDSDLAIPWGVDDPLLSARDAAAPSLADAQGAGWLPALPGYESKRP